MEGVPVRSPFAGELFLTLAVEGRLVVDAVRADELIAGLERTHSSVQRRLRVLRQRRACPGEPVGELPDDVARDVVDAIFTDQIAPGRLEQADTEIPKYIEALRVARRPSATGDSGTFGEG